MLWNVTARLVLLQMATAALPGYALGPPAAPSQEPLPVHLVVSNRFGFNGRFLDSVGKDVSDILAAVGIDATWSIAAPSKGDEGDYRTEVGAADPFVVVFTPKPPEAWGVKERAMGMVVAGDFPRRRVMVFPQRVLRVLDLNQTVHRGPVVWFDPSVARAFARIVVHELVHALVPEHSHADNGLMRGTFDRELLMRQELSLDAGCRTALAEALRELRIDLESSSQGTRRSQVESQKSLANG